jgi:hypothetical protein
LTQLAGWAAYDDGKHALAQRYYRTALHAAHVAGDRLLGVYVLSMMAFQASNLEQYRESLLLLDSARHGGIGVNTPGVLSMLDAWESRAHALAGNREGFHHALGRASERFGRRRIQDDPDWLYWYRQPEHLAEMCRGFSLVGDHEQGIAHLSDRANVVDAEPSERDLILYHAYAGEAFLGLGELEAAAEHGHHALDLLGQDIASDRAFGYVKQLTGRLKPHHKNHAVRSLIGRVVFVLAPLLRLELEKWGRQKQRVSAGPTRARHTHGRPRPRGWTHATARRPGGSGPRYGSPQVASISSQFSASSSAAHHGVTSSFAGFQVLCSESVLRTPRLTSVVQPG